MEPRRFVADSRSALLYFNPGSLKSLLISTGTTQTTAQAEPVRDGEAGSLHHDYASAGQYPS
jgi:hypothetical protein